MNNQYRIIREKLQQERRLRVLFLNDIGFQYGAGIAHLRQIQSFLMLGHEVKGLCWMQGPVEGDIPFMPRDADGKWLGMVQLSQVHKNHGCTNDDIIHAITAEVCAIEPDVIIVGNLHGAQWPLELFLALKGLGSLVVAYMHDCFLVSGGCAYPGSCRQYEQGCDAQCATSHEYPVRDRSEIANAWKLRRKIFCGPDGVPIAANSSWTVKMAHAALKDLYYADVVYLGLDETLFSPLDKKLVRRMLGLPDDRFVILGGSVNVRDQRKGGHIFKKVVQAMPEDVIFLVFGAESSGMKNVRTTGLLRDFRKMPLLFNSADIFLGTALEEAFGQTLCEASACALPIVAFNVGGIQEMARHDVNARLVNDISPLGLVSEIKYFMSNPNERDKFGLAGRKVVESEFTLKRQSERWMEYLKKAVAVEN
jgi:glycosyltransferase involved in cell wall biosynthesis